MSSPIPVLSLKEKQQWFLFTLSPFSSPYLSLSFLLSGFPPPRKLPPQCTAILIPNTQKLKQPLSDLLVSFFFFHFPRSPIVLSHVFGPRVVLPCKSVPCFKDCLRAALLLLKRIVVRYTCWGNYPISDKSSSTPPPHPLRSTEALSLNNKTGECE